MGSHIYNVSGGGLLGVYTTVQFHLHWGSNNNKGSEHTMGGLMYPAEVCYLDDMYCVQHPRPSGFSLRKWERRPWGAPPIYYKEAVGTRLSSVK